MLPHQPTHPFTTQSNAFSQPAQQPRTSTSSHLEEDHEPHRSPSSRTGGRIPPPLSIVTPSNQVTSHLRRNSAASINNNLTRSPVSHEFSNADYTARNESQVPGISTGGGNWVPRQRHGSNSSAGLLGSPTFSTASERRAYAHSRTTSGSSHPGGTRPMDVAQPDPRLGDVQLDWAEFDITFATAKDIIYDAGQNGEPDDDTIALTIWRAIVRDKDPATAEMDLNHVGTIAWRKLAFTSAATASSGSGRLNEGSPAPGIPGLFSVGETREDRIVRRAALMINEMSHTLDLSSRRSSAGRTSLDMSLGSAGSARSVRSVVSWNTQDGQAQTLLNSVPPSPTYSGTTHTGSDWEYNPIMGLPPNFDTA